MHLVAKAIIIVDISIFIIATWIGFQIDDIHDAEKLISCNVKL